MRLGQAGVFDKRNGVIENFELLVGKWADRDEVSELEPIAALVAARLRADDHALTLFPAQLRGGLIPRS